MTKEKTGFRPVRCDGCRYYRNLDGLDGGGDYFACHYCIDTGRLRGVLPKDCYRHPGTPYREKSGEER